MAFFHITEKLTTFHQFCKCMQLFAEGSVWLSVHTDGSKFGLKAKL